MGNSYQAIEFNPKSDKHISYLVYWHPHLSLCSLWNGVKPNSPIFMVLLS
jgi:hypothetical protein